MLQAMDEAAKPDLHDVLDMKIGSKRANNSQRCKAMLKLAPGLADKVARKLVERVHQYTDKMAE